MTPATSSAIALTSVFRIVCPDEQSMGTAFLHKSGRLITAAHVVEHCAKPILILHDGQSIPVSVRAVDIATDLALLVPSSPVAGVPLAIRTSPNVELGAPVALWGFPAGFYGNQPMFSAGYLAGADERPISPTRTLRQWVVNAAFNGGNSGGPLVLVETGEVIGVVSSKVTGLSPITVGALDALKNNRSGITYSAQKPDGSQTTFGEGQVVAMVLEDLRNQVQLVIGRAVITGDVLTFLKANKIEP